MKKFNKKIINCTKKKSYISSKIFVKMHDSSVNIMYEKFVFMLTSVRSNSFQICNSFKNGNYSQSFAILRFKSFTYGYRKVNVSSFLKNAKIARSSFFYQHLRLLFGESYMCLYIVSPTFTLNSSETQSWYKTGLKSLVQFLEQCLLCTLFSKIITITLQSMTIKDN